MKSILTVFGAIALLNVSAHASSHSYACDPGPNSDIVVVKPETGEIVQYNADGEYLETLVAFRMSTRVITESPRLEEISFFGADESLIATLMLHSERGAFYILPNDYRSYACQFVAR